MCVDLDRKSLLVQMKNDLRRKIFTVIPEQKIDITVATPAEIQQDPFLSVVIQDAILLKSKSE